MIVFPVILAAGILAAFGFAAGYHSRRRCRIARMSIFLTPPSICVGLAVWFFVSPAWVAQLKSWGIIGDHDLLALYVLLEIIAVVGTFALGPAWGWIIAQIVAGRCRTNGTNGLTSRPRVGAGRSNR